MKSHLYFFLSTYLLISSSEDFNGQNLSSIEAKVVFSGSEAADGCGWLLKVSEELTYKPDQLPEEFKIDCIEVHTAIKVLDSTYTCGFPSPKSPLFQKMRLFNA